MKRFDDRAKTAYTTLYRQVREGEEKACGDRKYCAHCRSMKPKDGFETRPGRPARCADCCAAVKPPRPVE